MTAMDDIYTRDGRPLELQGLAIPYGIEIRFQGDPEQFAPGCFADVPTGRWHTGRPVVWQHDDDHVVADRHRVEITDTPRGLFFRAWIPDSPFGRHAAVAALGGRLGCSIAPQIIHKDRAGVVTAATLGHIGLTFDPAYPTSCWRSDDRPDALPEHAQQIRARYATVAAAASVRRDEPVRTDSSRARIAAARGPMNVQRPEGRRDLMRIAQAAMRSLEKIGPELEAMNRASEARARRHGLERGLAGGAAT